MSNSPYHTNEEEAIPFMISAHRVSNEMARFFNIHPENRILGNQMAQMLIEYVIEHKLIKPDNHKKVICNDPLYKLLKVDSFMTQDLQTLLSAHMTPVRYGELIDL